MIVDDEGLHTAAGVAEIAAQTATDVCLVSRKESPVAHLGTHRAYALPRLVAAGVRILPHRWVTEIGPDRVRLVDLTYRTEETIEAVDEVVLATMRQPVDVLSAVAREIPYAYVVGDTLSPRGLHEATYEGYRFGRVIGEADMPRTVTDELWDAPMPVLRPRLRSERATCRSRRVGGGPPAAGQQEPFHGAAGRGSFVGQLDDEEREQQPTGRQISCPERGTEQRQG